MEDLKKLKIAISGKSGCGNTTVSHLLAKELDLSFINFTFRNIASERNISLKEVLSLASQSDDIDREVDRRQVELARAAEGCVLGSRLAIWMLEEADLKVFLTAKEETRAKRIQDREGGDLASIAEFTAERDRQDRERYIRIYGIDNNDHSFADMIIDTDDIGPRDIVKLIVARLTVRG